MEKKIWHVLGPCTDVMWCICVWCVCVWKTHNENRKKKKKKRERGGGMRDKVAGKLIHIILEPRPLFSDSITSGTPVESLEALDLFPPGWPRNNVSIKNLKEFESSPQEKNPRSWILYYLSERPPFHLLSKLSLEYLVWGGEWPACYYHGHECYW